MASDVGQYFSFEAELADGFAIGAGLLGGSGRSELDVVDAEIIEGAGDFDFGFGVEEGIRELLAFAEGGFDDFKAGG